MKVVKVVKLMKLVNGQIGQIDKFGQSSHDKSTSFATIDVVFDLYYSLTYNSVPGEL